MCGDNGVVKEGVTQTGQEVTAIVAGNMARGNSCVCLMARQAGADVIPVDVGMACRDAVPGVVNRKVAYGTKDFLEEPAMTREETVKAMEAGADMAVELKERGYVLAGSGEMGIGNTTTSSACFPCFLIWTGTGDGPGGRSDHCRLQPQGTGHKGRHPHPKAVRRGSGGRAVQSGRTGFGGSDRILHRMRGLRPAGGAGRTHNRGSSSGSCQNQPDVKGYLLASHVSAEPAGAMVLDALGLKPAISAGMCLGEGTGATALFPLLDMAAAVYTQMSSFDDIHVDAYEHLV